MPWITKKPSQSSNFPSIFFASFFITSLHKRSSPSFFRREKDKTFVGLSFFLYFLFIFRDFSTLTYAIEREYSLPRISSFIFSKRIELFCRHLTEFFEFLNLFSSPHSLQGTVLHFQF